jgi:hypothetical protein
MTPIWATLLVAVIAVVGPWLAYQASLRNTNAIRLNAIEANSTANRALEQAAETARQSNETARQANALSASKSDRELIMQALELARSDNARAQQQAWALLDGLSRMPGLSPDDAILVQQVTRPMIEGTLSQGRRIEEVEKDEVTLHYVIDEDDGEEGDGGED